MRVFLGAVVLAIVAVGAAYAQVIVTPPPPLNGAVARAWVFPQIHSTPAVSANYTTCVAVLNLGDQRARVQVATLSGDGAVLTRLRFAVEPGGQVRNCLQRSPRPNNNQWLAVTADRPVLPSVEQWTMGTVSYTPGSVIDCATPRGIERMCQMVGRELDPVDSRVTVTPPGTDP
jgi:hypothetical protein